MWMTSCTGSERGGFGGFWKSQLSWVLRSEEEEWLSLARGGLATGAHVLGGRWKSQNRKNVYLSPYVEEPLNSKVIKSFVPELRSRKCFSCFGIPMFYVYMLWTFYVRFPYPYQAILYICIFHIGMLCPFHTWRLLWLWYSHTKDKKTVCPTILPIAGGRLVGFILFSRVLKLCEMQTASSRIWTQVVVSISYDDIHYTMSTSG